MEVDINVLAVVVATIAHQVLGFLWYGPLFGKLWLREVGKTREEIAQGPATGMIIAVVGSLLSALAIALLLTLSDDPTVGLGLAVGAVAGVGFAAASTFTTGAFEERKPKVSALFSGYRSWVSC